MICLGILWNSMENYKDEVLKDISEYGTVVEKISINLNDNYEKFVREIYAQDNIADWKVDKKLETMFLSSDSRNVTIVFLNIKTSEQEFHPLKKRMVYRNLENMKVNIRKKYSEKIPYYFFDNVFHVTDDENEFYADYDVVKKYITNTKDKVLIKSIKKETN